MKSFYLLFLLMAAGFCAMAQSQWGFNYSASLPLQEMKKNINLTHSLNASILSKFRGAPKFSWGFETGFGLYASFTKEQDIRFSDGSGITSDVTYSSNVVNAGLLLRYHFF